MLVPDIFQSIQLAWIAIGLLLILAEFIVPGFIICFFGAGAILVGGLLWIFPSIPAPWQIILFAAFSLALLFSLRRLMPKAFSGSSKSGDLKPDDEEFSGEQALVVEDILPGRPGKIYLNGSLWTARSEDSFSSGELADVVRRENITVIVKRGPGSAAPGAVPQA